MWPALRPVLLKSLTTTRCVRLVHQQCYVTAQQLANRAIVKVSGVDAGPFLQGLMTNDIKHLDEENANSMYCMFLNTQGRILYDTVIYSTTDSGGYLLECDSEHSSALAKHLSTYRVRRKVAITVEESLRPWVLFDQPPEGLDRKVPVLAKDPRVKELGWRAIVESSKNLGQLVDNLRVEDKDRYTELRYQLGVSEGSRDMPPGTSFPLECNCDYLHGVSFHKGCYLGQELTARTYHTGVIRKRIMPVVFEKPVGETIEPDAVVTSDTGTKVGKLRGSIRGSVYGLGMLRLQQAFSSTHLSIDSNVISTHRPAWWPIEAPKDRTRLDSSS